MFSVVVLPIVFGCAEKKISNAPLQKNVTLPLASSETRNRPVTWGGSPHLEPGLNPKDIILFEDFEDDHYRKR